MELIHRIPDSIKQDVIAVVDAMRPYMPNPPKDLQEDIFEVYNKYIAITNKQSIGCPKCRTQVWGTISRIVDTWKTETKTSETA